MKAINYLKKIKDMDKKINADIDELAVLQALATRTTSVLGDERVQSSGSQQKMADCVDKIVDAKKAVNDEIDKFIDYKKEARKMIQEHCDGDCIELLQKRYFGAYDEATGKTIYKTWEQIAVEMGFTYQWVSGGLHQRALAQIQKALDERKEMKDECCNNL